MELQLPKYEPSGRFKPTAIVMLVGAIIAGALAAWVYQALVRWIPFIILKALAVVAFGFVVSMLSIMTVSVGQVRNRIVGVALGLLVATGSVAGSYFWAYQDVVGELVEANPGVTRAEVMEQYTFPLWVQDKVEAGWSMSRRSSSSGGTQFNGFFVYLVWGIEALLMLGVGAVMAYGNSATPYCEDCGRWTKENTTQIHGRTREDVMPLLQSNQVGHLLGMEPPENADQNQWIVLKAHSCPNCSHTWMSVSDGKKVTGKDGKEQVTTNSIADYLELAPRQAQDLRARVGLEAKKAA